MPSYLLNDRDREQIQSVLDWRRLQQVRRPSTRDVSSDSDHLRTTPELFLARTPIDGIPAMSSELGYETGTGTGYTPFTTPGFADCDIYRAIERSPGAGTSTGIGFGPEIVPMEFTKRVLSIRSVAIAGNEWIIVAKDKLGTWWVIEATSDSDGEGGGTVTADEVETELLEFTEPAQVAITANTNDLVIGDVSVVDLIPTANWNLTGIVPADPDVSQLLLLRNTDPTFTVTLTDNSAGGSLAGNSFAVPGGTSYPLGPESTAMLLYDPTTGVWRPVTESPADVTRAVAIATNQNNYDLGLNDVVEITASSTPAFTGFLPFSGTRLLLNNGSTAFTLPNESGSSSAANRIVTPTGGTVSIPVNSGVMLNYNTTLQRTQIVGYYQPGTVIADGDYGGIVVSGSGTVVEVVNTDPTVNSEASNYTLTDDDRLLLADASGGAFTVTMDGSPFDGQEHTVKKTDSSVNPVTLGTIDGAAVVLYVQNDFVSFKWDDVGGAWRMVADGRKAHTAKITGSATSLPDSTWTKLTLNGEVWDVGPIADNVTNYRITFLRLGRYLVTGKSRINTTLDDGEYYELGIYFGGSLIGLPARQYSCGTGQTVICEVTEIVECTSAGQYVELFGWQNSGGSVDTNNPDQLAVAELRP